MSRVKALREKFEKSSSKPLTPTQFQEAQKEAALKEAKAILEARRKAATYNMTVRALHLKNYAESKPRDGVQEIQRNEARQKARKYSLALQKAPQAAEAVATQKERRATQVLLLSMAQELEAEIKAEENESKKAEELLKIQQQQIEQVESEMAAENAERDRQALEAAEAKAAAEIAAAQALAEAELARNAALDAEARSKEAEEEARKAWLLAEENNDRITLTNYLQEHHPDRLGEVETLLKDFKGNLDVLFEELSRARVEAAIAEEKKAEAAKPRESRVQSTVQELEAMKEEVAAAQAAEAEISAASEAVASATTDDASGSNSTAAAAEAAATTTSSSSTAAAESAIAASAYKRFLNDEVALDKMLQQFYTVYAPSKISDVEAVMKHFEGRENDLIHTLELKYNVTFMADGSCTPNDAADIGEPFYENSKFAVDVQKYTLRERLRKIGASPDKVEAVLSSSSDMM